jgi:hypothetical protein
MVVQNFFFDIVMYLNVPEKPSVTLTNVPRDVHWHPSINGGLGN